MANFRPGAFFCADSFIPSSATPPYGPGSPHTRTVPVLACARAALGAAAAARAPAVVEVRN